MNSSDQDQKVRDYGLRMLARREHSVAEFSEKLKKRFPDADIQVLAQEFVDQDWLSDTRYCEAFIRHQKITTQAGPFLLHQKLRQKGIRPDMIQEQIKQHFPEPEQAIFKQKLSDKKRPLIKAQNDFEREQKLRRYLAGKGY